MLWDTFVEKIEAELNSREKDFLKADTIAKTVCPTDIRMVPKLRAILGPDDKDILDVMYDTVWGKPTLHPDLKISLSTIQSGRYIKLMKDYFIITVIQIISI